MVRTFKAALAVTILALSLGAQPSVAADRDRGKEAAKPGEFLKGLAVADLDYVFVNSTAFKAAVEQRKVTYKQQFEAANARRTDLIAQLQGLADKYNKDRLVPNADKAALQASAEKIGQVRDAGNQDITKLLEPVRLSELYVKEQIQNQLGAAVKAAMKKGRITVLLKPQDLIAIDNSYNINPAILGELNALLPAAQLVPPVGWQPGAAPSAPAQQQSYKQSPAPSGSDQG